MAHKWPLHWLSTHVVLAILYWAPKLVKLRTLVIFWKLVILWKLNILRNLDILRKLDILPILVILVVKAVQALLPAAWWKIFYGETMSCSVRTFIASTSSATSILKTTWILWYISCGVVYSWTRTTPSISRSRAASSGSRSVSSSWWWDFFRIRSITNSSSTSKIAVLVAATLNVLVKFQSEKNIMNLWHFHRNSISFHFYPIQLFDCILCISSLFEFNKCWMN